MTSCQREFSLRVNANPVDCDAFSGITWGAPGITITGGGSASATLVGNSIIAQASIPVSGGATLKTAIVNFSGSFPYTGGVGGCCLNWAKTGSGGNILISQDATTLIEMFGGEPNGVYPFTIPAAGGVIAVSGIVPIYGTFDPAAESRSITVTIGSC